MSEADFWTSLAASAVVFLLAGGIIIGIFEGMQRLRDWWNDKGWD